MGACGIQSVARVVVAQGLSTAPDLSLCWDMYKPPIVVSLFPFKILVLPQEVRLLELFFPTQAVNFSDPVGEGDPDFGTIFSGEGLFMLLAKIPLAWDVLPSFSSSSML